MKEKRLRTCTLIVLSLLSISSAAGQGIKRNHKAPAPADTLRHAGLRSDTLRSDTLKSAALRLDTAGAAGDSSRAKGIDTLVTYSSTDSIVYEFATRTMSLYVKGQIKYRDLQLTADRIDIDWSRSVMTAQGIPDTSDSTGKKYKGTPDMKDGNELYHGHELSYNFQTKKGRIDVANTTIDQGYYHGDEIKKVEKDVLFVEDGRYTTCDLPEPHYFFFSPKMKVIPHDNVVAEPVYLYIADVPVFALPFGVFPNQHGRRSGLIAPAYGEDAQRGRFLRHLGYYWAISDYMDINFRSDLYTKGGWGAYSTYRYALRYDFTGSFSGEYKRFHTGESSDPLRTEEESYTVNIAHNQEFDPTTHLNANFSFASNNAYRNTIDLNQALNQFITSNATLSKSWEGTPNSISLGITRSQDLLHGRLDETLPSILFNHSQSYPFRWGKPNGDELNLPWYQDIGFSYSADAANSRSKVPRTFDTIKIAAAGIDSVHSVDDFEIDRTQTLSQRASLSIAPKLGYITISPSLSYQDSRSVTDNDVPVRVSADSSLQTVNSRQWQRAGVLSSGISASTRLYAIGQPGILGIAAIRHTMTPSLSFTYQKQIVGEDLAGRQMFMNLSIGNIFEMKTIPSEEGKEGSKIQLLNLGAGISYNFSADSLRFSPISLSYRTGIGGAGGGGGLDIGGSAAFDLYKLVETKPGEFTRVNKFLINEEGRLARLTSFQIALSTSLSGQRKTSAQAPAGGDSLAHRRMGAGYANLNQEEEPDFSIPWNLSLTLDYSENKVPGSQSRASNVRGHLDFNLTESWKISVNGAYDVFNRDILAPEIQISRDLHCWLMNFEWVPTGTYRHYLFEIRVKAPQLHDIKITKSGSDRGIY